MLIIIPSELYPESWFIFVPAALQSVFPQTELGTFMVLLKKDKEQQLRELTLIVTGVQLFNKAGKKGAKQTDLRELSTVHQPTELISLCLLF